MIVDETMHTFKFEFNESGKKSYITVQKHRNTFKFSIPKERNAAFNSTKYIIINGSDLTKRPEDRIKKLAKLVNKLNRNDNQIA
jgi:RNase P/RNase MRP subunit p29